MEVGVIVKFITGVKTVIGYITRIISHLNNANKSLKFVFIIVALVVPIVLIPLSHSYMTASQYHQKGYPRVVNAAIDVTGIDFSEPISLEGDWEFYPYNWIISENNRDVSPEPQQISLICNIQNEYAFKEGRSVFFPERSYYASYKIRLEGFPKGKKLACYVPNSDAAYRVFFNNQLVAYSGQMSKLVSISDNSNFADIPVNSYFPSFSVPSDGIVEVVVESSDNYGIGIHHPPVLADAQLDSETSILNYVVVFVYIGVIFTVMFCIVLIVIINKSRRGQLCSLIYLNLLVLLRMVNEQDFFDVTKAFLPFFRLISVHALIVAAGSFIPVLLMLVAKDLLFVPISRKELKFSIIFESIVCVCTFLSVICFRSFLTNILFYVGCLPYIILFLRLYSQYKKGLLQKPIVVIGGMLLTIACCFFSSLPHTNMLSSTLSLHAPTCFIIGVILQGYIYIVQNQQFQQQALEAANLRLQLKNTEVALMMSQIKPHFLYNALLAIHTLCYHSPENAADAILKFSKYLRQNMNAINSPEPIPFSKELEHVKNYVHIEKLRFCHRLNVKYNIGADDFLVPPLTIQPIVENAILHGATKRIQGGLVTISTFLTESHAVVEIHDNGKGFPVNAESSEESRPVNSRHGGQAYGLENIIFRLKNISNGTIDISSSPELGTTVTVKIPNAQAYPS